ncbi:unnamed protein product, partial [Scytosiphon promiscuus]
LEHANGALPSGDDPSFPFKAVLRKAVLMCAGKGPRSPHLEKSGDGSEDLRLNFPSKHDTKATSRRKGDAKTSNTAETAGSNSASGLEKGGGASETALPPGKTVLLVKGKRLMLKRVPRAASLWGMAKGNLTSRALVDLVEGGDVRSLFSDTELLDMATADELRATQERNVARNGTQSSRGIACAAKKGGPKNESSFVASLPAAGETSFTDEAGGGPGSTPTGKPEIPRWSCWTRDGNDFLYRRMVSIVRQHLTVVLCVNDDEVAALCPTFPALSTCPSVRLQAWSAGSMESAAARSLSTHLRLSDSRPGSAGCADRENGRLHSTECYSEFGCKSRVCMWPGSTHAHLVGLLAFGRFQSTIPAFEGPPKGSAPATSGGPGNGPVLEPTTDDGQDAAREAERLFDAWMVLAQPASCVEVFRAVEAYGGSNVGENCSEIRVQPCWDVVKEQCFRAMTEEGRGPRPASLEEVLLLFKHFCKLGCRRQVATQRRICSSFVIVERARILQRAVKAANVWGLHEAHREAEKVQLKKRAKDVIDALDQNNEQVRRAQQEKTRVQEFWGEQSRGTREQRQAQYVRNEQVVEALQPIQAAYEASRASLSALQEEDMEFLCTLCLGSEALSSTTGTSSHVAAATQQRKQKGLHPELPFIVETVAVMLGNMSGFPQWVGEWVRLKASPAVKVIRALLLDPAVVDRLNSFDPESEAGQKVVKLVIDKMTERSAAEASKKGNSDGGGSATRSPGSAGGVTNSDGGGTPLASLPDSSATLWAREIPVLALKIESRACGLLAGWVQATVVLVEAFSRAKELRAEIQVDARATHHEEERIRLGNEDEVAPLDKELELRATNKSRLSTRQRTVHHRSDLIKELGIMNGAIEDFTSMCWQELHDLAAAAEVFAGDALCFASVTCLAAHLPHTLRAIALYRGRDALRRTGIPTSGWWVREDNQGSGQANPLRRSAAGTKQALNDDFIPEITDVHENSTSATDVLALKRHCAGNFAAGVLTNLVQLQNWAFPSDSEVEGDGREDSSEESDDGQCGADGDNASALRRKTAAAATVLPYHPAFMDAAVLTLCTPKWPLIWDPEGIALRWLRHVYPGQALLETLLPASAVSMDIITTCAGKGEILPVCSTEGGIHSDLASFLGSDVVLEGEVQRGESTRRQQDSSGGPNIVGGGGGIGERDGFVTVSEGPLSSITIRIKFGFRLILFTRSLDFSKPMRPRSSSGTTPLVFLEDSPEGLARVQLIRFGGVDSVGISTTDDGAGCLPESAKDDEASSRAGQTSDGRDSAAGDDESSASSSSSGEQESGIVPELAVPPLVLAGLGLTHQPGFEMSMSMGARLQEEIVQSFPLAFELGGAEGTRIVNKSMERLARAQREALAYSCHLSATHEAVIAILADRTPSFEVEGTEAERPRPARDFCLSSGGAPAKGVSDEVEQDQNRILNNLIETLFAYKCALEKGLDTVPNCNRGFQATQAKAALKAERVPHRLSSAALRLLARSGDMLYAYGSDPVWYSPVFPGVKALIHGAIRRAPDAASHQKQTEEGAIERIVVRSLTRSMVARVDSTFTWIFPLAALATTGPGDLPAKGWWDTCVALVADRQSEKRNNSRCTSRRLTLAGLFKTVMVANARASRPEKERTQKPNRNPTEETELTQACPEGARKNATVARGLAQVGEVGPSLSPQRWDLGFDTSGWARDEGAAAVAALARDLGIPCGAKSVEGGSNDPGGEVVETFLSTLSQLWTGATADRAKMTAIQASEAEAFSSDDVLRRLVLLETTMNSVFARLPGFVMCEPRRWSEWIAEVNRSLSSVEEGHGDVATIRWLRFLLSHPPPVFESEANVGGARSSSDPSSTEDDECDDSDDSSGDSGDSISGTERDEQSDSDKTSKDTTVVSKADAADATTGQSKPVDAQGAGSAHNKVRRDSRERLKLKLKLVDGLGVEVGDEDRERDLSAATTKEFAVRASKLFGVSTSTTKRGVTTRKPPDAADATGAVPNNGGGAHSGPTTQLAESTKTSPVSPNLSANTDTDEDGNVEQAEEATFITFVAESFRPRRDESDWHREVKSEPPPTPDIPPGDASAIAVQVVQVEKGVESVTSMDEDSTPRVDETAQEPPTAAVSAPSDAAGPAEGSGSNAGPPSETSAGSGATSDLGVVNPTDTRVGEMPIASPKDVAVPADTRCKFPLGRWDQIKTGRRLGNVGSASVGMAALSAMRLVRTKRRQLLQVPVEELGLWPQPWNDSPLIGIVLLLALAPDGQLAAKCASACLMFDGVRDNLQRSSAWREVMKEAALGDAQKGRMTSALETSRRWIPIVVMTPAKGGVDDAVGLHFMSVLSHIERAAKEAGTTVTVHDASKPAHVLLSRGALVGQARRAHPGHSKAGGRGITSDAKGGPAMANMAQSAWEVCLKAAAEGGWIVVKDFEGVADHVSLILDGIRRRSGVRCASTAAAEEQGKLQRGQQAAGKTTAGAISTEERSGSSAKGPTTHHGTTRPGGAGAAPTAGAKIGGLARRVVIPGRARQNHDFVSKMRPDYPLFKALPQGEGGVMSTRAQAPTSAAMRRPLPVPHKNFRIIFVAIASPEERARDDCRSFGTGESTVVWWRPASTSLPLGARAAAATSSGGIGEGNKSLVDSCRNELLQELRDHTAANHRALSDADASLDVISANFGRLIEREASGQTTFSVGAAINMHLAASLTVLLGADATGASTPNSPVWSPPGPKDVGVRRNNRSSASAPSGPSQSPDHGTNRDSVEGHNVTPSSQIQEHLTRVADGAARASAVSTELANFSVVDLVAGVLDADGMRAREVGLLEVVQTKVNKTVTEVAP